MKGSCTIIEGLTEYVTGATSDKNLNALMLCKLLQTELPAKHNATYQIYRYALMMKHRGEERVRVWYINN
jgi:hypothetical protein